MNKFNRFFVYVLCSGLITTYLPQSMADQQDDNTSIAATVNTLQSQQPCSYAQKINEKALRMVSNFDSSLLEIPKNIINTTNDSNIFYGLTGGLAKGLINTLGRVSVGFADFISLPIPTKPVAYPLHVWDDFDKDTQYNDIFRLDNCPPSDEVIATPDVPAVQTKVVAVPPRPVPDNFGGDNEHTNRKLDTLFKKQMMK
ncbi:MAG: exosortase system-associated protein, TIGR04073 family [Methylovulum sp.]|uniref:exosortase system-associated protein, TIGR04073 family n=1 Tax=Methylovulum sp. TaxID=1916980 RepID=UPI00262DDD2E|nr:exosortase system-associated protein, TIGR04073 family [Methylovulum sp.]MDD2725662.1 exosortase system-associated protein, TIGR04073 family [Methylovulum sp.]MDD5126257.1 exosortase system-associated protein, TIGR04073 family [Methylovulum sp.]